MKGSGKNALGALGINALKNRKVKAAMDKIIAKILEENPGISEADCREKAMAATGPDLKEEMMKSEWRAALAEARRERIREKNVRRRKP